MSQADPQNSFARLQQTLSQLQAVLSSLDQTDVQISATVLDQWVSDTETLVQQLQRDEIPSAPPPEIVSPVTDEWDEVFSESESEPEPVPPVVTKPPISPTPTVRPRRKQPWWQQQKVIIGAISAAIALIFIWKFATGTPTVTEEIAQSPTTPTEQVEPVMPETPTPEPAPQPQIETPTPEPTAEPPKPLTPEQRLIAAIQAQLDEVTQPYGDNIVRSIQADFDQNTLRITVGDAWYLLKEGLQDQLGIEVLKLAQILDFKKMVVTDLQGNFVARNPVVGDRLVIVRRYQDFDAVK